MVSEFVARDMGAAEDRDSGNGNLDHSRVGTAPRRALEPRGERMGAFKKILMG